LIERGFFNERYLYELIGDAIKIPYVNLRKRRIDPEAIVCLDAKIAEEIQAIPFSLDNDILKIAFVDPRNQEHIEAVQANVKYKFKPFMTSARNFAFAFRSAKTKRSANWRKKSKKSKQQTYCTSRPQRKKINTLITFRLVFILRPRVFLARRTATSRSIQYRDLTFIRLPIYTLSGY
jgi:hypothetical protein